MDEIPGEFEDIGHHKDAFVPKMINRIKFQPDKETLRFTSLSSYNLGRLNCLENEFEEPEVLIEPFIRKEAITSSEIEEINEDLPSLYEYRTRGDSEKVSRVQNYVEALEFGIHEINNGREFDLELVKDLHRELLTDVESEADNIGVLREDQRVLRDRRGNIQFIPCPPGDRLEMLTRNSVSYLRNSNRYDPVTKAGIFHYHFEVVHPFEDGNGRIGRLIIVLYLYYAGIIENPYLYLSSYFNERRSDYMEELSNVTHKGTWNSWLQFYSKGIGMQAEEAYIRGVNLSNLQSEYIEKIKQNGRYVDKCTKFVKNKLFAYPFIRTDTLKRIGYADDTKTANRLINVMMDIGILEDKYPEKDRYKTYYCPEFLDYVSNPLRQLPWTPSSSLDW